MKNLTAPASSPFAAPARATFEPPRSALTSNEAARTVDLANIAAPNILRRPRQTHARELRLLRRKESAAEAVAGLDRETELYGFTKGQFSLLDLLVACLEITGPVDFTLSTWTAARHEITQLAALRDAGKLRSMRWLCDWTFVRRDPEAAHMVRTAFGADAIRVAQCHSKFAIFSNRRWKLCLRTSMNLNMNPRTEDFTLAHDPPLARFLETWLEEIWQAQSQTLADAHRAADVRHFFRNL